MSRTCSRSSARRARPPVPARLAAVLGGQRASATSRCCCWPTRRFARRGRSASCCSPTSCRRSCSAPLFGALADRSSRRALVVGAELLCGAAFVGLAFAARSASCSRWRSSPAWAPAMYHPASKSALAGLAGDDARSRDGRARDDVVGGERRRARARRRAAARGLAVGAAAHRRGDVLRLRARAQPPGARSRGAGVRRGRAVGQRQPRDRRRRARHGAGRRRGRRARRARRGCAPPAPSAGSARSSAPAPPRRSRSR